MLFISLLVLKYLLFLDLILPAVFSDINYTGNQKSFSPTYLRHFEKLLKNQKLLKIEK